MTAVGIVGGGAIGVGFAIVFARAGHPVRLQDPDPGRRAAVPGEIADRLAGLAEFGLIDESAAEIAARVVVVDTLEEAAGGAGLVQECAPEQTDVKAALFARLDRVAPAAAILATASSAIPVSRFAAGLSGRGRCLVAHPGNPPWVIPVIEVVPAAFTDPAVADRAASFYADCGMSPVRLNREVEGFVFNRLQGALLREAYCLVRDGVADVADIDRLVRDGLGMRWSVVGPFEAVDLNTRGGIAAHAERMGPAYARMGAERGQDDPWTPELVARVAGQRRVDLPPDGREARIRWRDRELLALSAHRRGRATGSR
ncbi:MAG: 3-hydroxyacyl-CoA dehydrogenase [Gammaproteobacteria bacterium]|nr:3-hydroxyacyl-CoA dehydrogenase [Gammaproteobacteria bacterium]